jgi:hypothetical protein
MKNLPNNILFVTQTNSSNEPQGVHYPQFDHIYTYFFIVLELLGLYITKATLFTGGISFWIILAKSLFLYRRNLFPENSAKNP